MKQTNQSPCSNLLDQTKSFINLRRLVKFRKAFTERAYIDREYISLFNFKNVHIFKKYLNILLNSFLSWQLQKLFSSFFLYVIYQIDPVFWWNMWKKNIFWYFNYGFEEKWDSLFCEKTLRMIPSISIRKVWTWIRSMRCPLFGNSTFLWKGISNIRNDSFTASIYLYVDLKLD